MRELWVSFALQFVTVGLLCTTSGSVLGLGEQQSIAPTKSTRVAREKIPGGDKCRVGD